MSIVTERRREGNDFDRYGRMLYPADGVLLRAFDQWDQRKCTRSLRNLVLLMHDYEIEALVIHRPGGVSRLVVLVDGRIVEAAGFHTICDEYEPDDETDTTD